MLEDGTTTLDNLWSTVPAGEAYSFQFNGLLQTLDHMVVSEAIKVDIADFRYAHFDNDYVQRSTQPDDHKASDHDAPVLTLRAGGPVHVVPEAPTPWALAASGAVILAGGFVLLRARRSLPSVLAHR